MKPGGIRGFRLLLAGVVIAISRPTFAQPAPVQALSRPLEVQRLLPLVSEGEPEALLPSVASNSGFGLAPWMFMEPPNTLRWSPDGQRLATAHAATGIELWDGLTGRWLQHLDFPCRPALPLAEPQGDRALTGIALAWSPDGAQLASVGQDFTAIGIQEVKTAREVRCWKGHAAAVNALAWSPDGKWVASASSDRTAKLWNTESGKEVLSLAGQGAPVLSVAFSPDSQRLASGSADSTVALWAVSSGQRLHQLTRHQGEVRAVAWSPDGRRLASGGNDPDLRIWDPLTGNELLSIRTGRIHSLDWFPDSHRVATGSELQVALWDASTGQHLESVLNNVLSPAPVAVNPRRNTLAVGGTSSGASLWSPDLHREPRPLLWPTTSIGKIEWSPDGKTLASGHGDQTVRLWETASGRELERIAGQEGAVEAISWSLDGSTLALASGSAAARLWDLKTDRELPALDPHTSLTTGAAAYSPDGALLATGTAGGDVWIWNLGTKTAIRRFRRTTGAHMRLAWSPDGKWLAASDWQWHLSLWEVGAGREVTDLPDEAAHAVDFAWGPQGKLLMAGLGNTVIFDANRATTTLREVYSLSVAWSPSGKLLALGHEGGRISLWEGQSFTKLREFSAHPGDVTALRFRPDGRGLASASGDLRLWDIDAQGAPQLRSVMWGAPGGWAAWRSAPKPEQRVLRGEDGSLVLRRSAPGTLDSVPPAVGEHPLLRAQARNLKSSEGQAVNQIAVNVENRASDSSAIWVRLSALEVPKEWVLDLPPTELALAPGAQTELRLFAAGPCPGSPNQPSPTLRLGLHHAHDQGHPLQLSVPLKLCDAGPPAQRGASEHEAARGALWSGALWPRLWFALLGLGLAVAGGLFALWRRRRRSD